jgi:FlaA1/EpsC-like NDP-sugar epimerase
MLSNDNLFIKQFVLCDFINEYVTKRSVSMFKKDLDNNELVLSQRINNKKILVVGGAGSIGSSFVKEILRFKPSQLIVVDINENALAELTRDLRSTKGLNIPNSYIPYPMDYSSEVFEKMFRNNGGFDIICNFSAHKHVRSEKDIYSIEALIKNNVIFAKKFLDLLTEIPPEVYFCVSTDKAANPVNIMGASKRIMEDLIFSYSDIFPVKTARFANVAFSNGSLLDSYLYRIKKLQPLSAPYDVKRYFVSPEEAGQICLLACILGNNREIFFPKLSEEQMISFDYIGDALLKEHGYEILKCSSELEAINKSEELKNGSNDYPVYYSISDTSGEKKYEEFYTLDESVDFNRFISLGVIVGKVIPERKLIDILLNDFISVMNKNDLSKDEIVSIIGNYLPNFKHIETGKCLDDKM